MARKRKPISYERINPTAIARRLVCARVALDLSKAEIADAIGLDRSSWIKCENNERVIGPDHAAKLAERFGITMDYVYRGVIDGIPDYSLRARLIDASRRL